VPSARTEDRVEALRDVLTELRRMETLVGDLLALARLEAAARAARRPFRLDHVLADVHRDALRTAPAWVPLNLGPLPGASSLARPRPPAPPRPPRGGRRPGPNPPQPHRGAKGGPAPGGRGGPGRAGRPRHRHRHR